MVACGNIYIYVCIYIFIFIYSFPRFAEKALVASSLLGRGWLFFSVKYRVLSQIECRVCVSFVCHMCAMCVLCVCHVCVREI